MDPGSKALCLGQYNLDDQLESAKAEMCQVRAENQRLKKCLDRIMKDCQSLQMKFYQTIQQRGIFENKTPLLEKMDNNNQEIEESELVVLSLGTCSSEPKISVKAVTPSQEPNDHDQVNESSMSFGLVCKFEAPGEYEANPETLPSLSNPVNCFEETKEDVSEDCPPGKVIRMMQNGGDDEDLQQNPAKKVRVSVRARCDAPTMNDGCQWRKYGQKIAKGNPFPRAYYRCAAAPSCPVKKQVQRCAEDMTILITTYEGTHNHPLPISAASMASATSAAASILLSGSTMTPDNPSTINTNGPANLHGLNFYLSSNNSKPEQYYVHNASLSSSLSCPTIILDLASTASSSASPFNRHSSTHPPVPKFSPTSLNFSASEHNTFPWANGVLNYGSSTTAISNSTPCTNARSYQLGTSLNQPHVQKNMNPPISHQPYAVLPDAIAVATKAITTDPNFQSALVSALSSLIGTSSGNSDNANLSGWDNTGQ